MRFNVPSVTPRASLSASVASPAGLNTYGQPMDEVEFDRRPKPSTNGRGQPMDEVEFDRRPKPPSNGRGQPMDEVEFDRRPHTPKSALTGGPVAHAPVGKVDFDPWGSTATSDASLCGQPMDEVEFD